MQQWDAAIRSGNETQQAASLQETLQFLAKRL